MSKVLKNQTEAAKNTASAVNLLDNLCFSGQSVREMNQSIRDELKKLNLSDFEFARVYDDGTAITLFSNRLIASHVIEKKIHITAHVPRDLVDQRFWYLPAVAGPYSQLIMDLKQIANSGAFVDYIERYKGYFDMFCFFSVNDQEVASSQFMNMKEKLEQVSYQFRDKAKDLIDTVSKERFLIPQNMRPNFKGIESTRTPNSEVNLMIHVDKLCREIERQGASNQIRLSKRELECIYFMILGKTSKEIAEQLGISFRTVEQFIESIRSKLGCSKKSEIIESLIRPKNAVL